MGRRLNIDDMHDAANARGGKFLSKDYVNSTTKYLWECAKGHTWNATADSIRNSGSWCPTCANESPLTIDDMHGAAEANGGKFLSKEYVNCRTEYLWECAIGHQWMATAGGVMHGGNWCPTCGGTKRLTIDDMHKLAEAKGGKFVSVKYVNTNTKYVWECAKRHRWEASANHVRNMGSWCPYCSGKMQLTAALMHHVAAERGGKFISNSYQRIDTYYSWECAEGHQWEATANSVWTKGKWCPECLRASKRKYSLKDLVKAAAAHGGKCLSDKYVNISEHYRWECAEGHQWESTGFCVINRGHWCLQCARRSGISIDDLRAVAKEKGGRCLSTEYVNSDAKYLWECRAGHQWEATGGHVLTAGTWCMKCAGKAALTVGDMHEMARERGGKFLSPCYVNISTDYLWECALGHRFETTASTIRSNGTWCPVCATQHLVGESLVREEFEDLLGYGFPKKKPKWLGGLELDGYCRELAVAFEHHGAQHYKAIEFFGGEAAFQKQVVRDKLKEELCEAHGVTLIVIPHVGQMMRRKDLRSLLVEEFRWLGLL